MIQDWFYRHNVNARMKLVIVLKDYDQLEYFTAINYALHIRYSERAKDKYRREAAKNPTAILFYDDTQNDVPRKCPHLGDKELNINWIAFHCLTTPLIKARQWAYNRRFRRMLSNWCWQQDVVDYLKHMERTYGMVQRIPVGK